MTTKYLELQKSSRKRLQKAETGLWDELLQEYIQELETTQSNGEAVLAWDLSRLIPQAQEENDAMKMAPKKIGGGGFREARSLLGGDPCAITVKAATKRPSMAAAAGPSQFTNHSVAALKRLPGGPKLLASWAGL